jgi:hypothetical protein
MLNGEVVVLKSRKLALTPLGLAARGVGQRLVALRNGEPEAELVEVLVVAVAHGVPAGLLASLVAGFLREFAGLARLRFIPLDPEVIRERIAAGEVAFAVMVDEDMGDTETIPGAELAWSIIARRDHALAKRTTPVSPADLRDGLQVALAPFVSESSAISELLSRLHPANRIDVPSREAAIQIAATGVAVALDLEFVAQAAPENDVLLRLELDGLAPARITTLLPRTPEARLSEPAKYLVERLRSAVREASLPPIPLPPPPDVASGADPDFIPEPLPA